MVFDHLQPTQVPTYLLFLLLKLQRFSKQGRGENCNLSKIGTVIQRDLKLKRH